MAAPVLPMGEKMTLPARAAAEGSRMTERVPSTFVSEFVRASRPGSAGTGPWALPELPTIARRGQRSTGQIDEENLLGR
jgi:hypothetical protein